MTTLDPRALRNAFGSFMTGVTVITSRDASGAPVGFTANSFTSVSLDPPLLLVCPGKFLSSYDAFTNCSHFAVNVLAEGQEEVSNTFAGYKGDRFAKVVHSFDLHDVPLIEGAVAQFSCKTQQVIPAGDHAILMGEVKGFTHSEGRGLGYVGGQYFSLGLERAALETVSGAVVYGAIIEQGENVLLEKTENGLRPPQITSHDRGSLREELHNALTDYGVETDIGTAYSVYDDTRTRTHYSYFLAEALSLRDHSPLISVPIRDLAAQQFTHPAIAEMLTRFALESRTRSFALYLGSTERGDVHTLSTRK